MVSLFVRILVAAVVVLLLLAVIPPFLHIVGMPMSGDLWAITRGVVCAVAILYVLFGPPVPSPLR